MAIGFKADSQNEKHPITTGLTNQSNKPTIPHPKKQTPIPPNFKDENGDWIQSIFSE